MQKQDLEKMASGRTSVQNNIIQDLKPKVLIENLPVGIFLFDYSGVIVASNQLFCEIFSVKQAELEGKKIDTYLKSSFKKEVEKPSPGNERFQKQQIELLNNQGETFQAEVSAFDSGIDNQILYLCSLVNRKDRKKLESELQKQIDLKDSFKDKLEEENELNDMKSRFLSIASHEFRTPLAGILSSLNLINRYLVADHETWSKFINREKVVNHLDKINESVKNLTTILQKFLALGNIEKGEIPVKYIKFNLKKTLASQAAQFQEICKPNQRISYVHESRNVTVSLDKYLLKNIMNNLLSNAIKFSPENSSIRVSSEITKNEIRIAVKDHGIGIPQSEQNKIFLRFFRARNALTYEEGTGLGLNIVSKYVELINGKITFDSEVNKGTTFKIVFPNNKR